MQVLTYVPSNVNLIISGLPISGWNEITVARNAPVIRQVRGIRGKNTRTRLKDSSAVITIETLQTELLNEVFTLALQADEQEGTARLELALTESTGTSFFTTSTAYITAYPQKSYSNEISSVVWTLACDESNMFIGNATSAAIGVVQGSVSQLKSFITDLNDQSIQ